jgi:hypothetical protein
MHRCPFTLPRLHILILLLCVLVACAVCSPLSAETPTPGVVDDYRARPDRYSVLVEDAVGALVKGDADRFRELLSPSLVKRTEATMGKGAIDTIIKERFVPFFADFAALNDAVETLPTRDADGHEGLALFRSFRTEDGEQRPFAIYLLNEDGELVVGNLLLNKLLYDVVRGERTPVPAQR